MIWCCYCTEDLTDEVSSRAVTSVGLFVLLVDDTECVWHPFPNERMCACLPDIKQFGKHGRLVLLALPCTSYGLEWPQSKQPQWFRAGERQCERN